MMTIKMMRYDIVFVCGTSKQSMDSFQFVGLNAAEWRMSAPSGTDHGRKPKICAGQT